MAAFTCCSGCWLQTLQGNGVAARLDTSPAESVWPGGCTQLRQLLVAASAEVQGSTALELL